MIPELRDLSYESRLLQCGLTTLETRRLRGDQIKEIFSLLCQLEKSDNILFVNYPHTFIYYRSPLIKHWIDQLYAFNS